jgi:outer membrane immunogenic protein
MRRHIGWALASVVSLGFSGLGAASAADMAVKALPVVAPVVVYNWTGCYIGAHAGGGWGRNRNDFGRAVASGPTEEGIFAPGEFGPFNHNTSGGVAGGQAGCNYQTANNFVIGIEGEAFWSGMKGSYTALEENFPIGDPGQFSRFESRNLWDADLALRLGYAWGRALLYGKAGVAFGNFSYTETHDDFPTTHACPGVAFVGNGFVNGQCSVSFNRTQTGLLLGLGLEYAFTNNWTGKVEYDYIDYGSFNLPYPSAGAAIQSFAVHETKQIVKVGVNYKFNWAQPVVAKY